MTTAEPAEGRADSRLPVRAEGLVSSTLLRWRLAGVVLVLAYVIQDLAGLRWTWLAQLQTGDIYKYATGSCLLTYVGWQWYLFLARLRGVRIRRLAALHQRGGVLAPVLFYAHSVQIGYGYLAVLSWILLANIVVGAVSPADTRIRSKSYTALWIATHVLLAVLTVVLGLFHAYIAVYYK